MSSRAAGVLALVAACGHHAATPTRRAPAAGIAIAIYDRAGKGYSVVDDRRWIETDGKTLELPRVDPGAALASLVIEPVAGDLHVGGCTRARIPEPAAPQADPHAKIKAVGRSDERYAPDVRCTASGAPGRYLVRVLYVSTTLTYRAQHEVTMTAVDRATITSRFAIATPAWQERASVVLYDGAPGGDHLPREVARGELALDGTTAVLAEAPRDVAAHLRRIYDGALLSRDTAPSDTLWGRESSQAVWVWLELAHVAVAPGPLHVHFDLADEGTRDVDVPAAARRDADGGLRLPVWIDDRLHGMRQRFGDYSAGAQLAERLLVSVANTGDVSREVWIEEHLRPARRHRVDRAWPASVATVGDLVRARVVVAPNKTEHVGFTVAYEF